MLGKNTQSEHLLRIRPTSIPYLSTYLSPRVGMSRNQTHDVRIAYANEPHKTAISH